MRISEGVHKFQRTADITCKLANLCLAKVVDTDPGHVVPQAALVHELIYHIDIVQHFRHKVYIFLELDDIGRLIFALILLILSYRIVHRDQWHLCDIIAGLLDRLEDNF